MKKRLLALLLALSMLMTCAMPGFAAEGISDSDIYESDTSDSDVATITDEDIEAVFNAHKAEKEALAGSDPSKVIEAFECFMDVADLRMSTLQSLPTSSATTLRMLIGRSSTPILMPALSIRPPH